MGFMEETMFCGDGTKWGPYGTANKMLKDVKAAGDLYINRPLCPFEVGDIITPKKNSNKKGRGLPHCVVRVFPIERSVGEAGAPERTIDIVTVVMLDGGRRSEAFCEDSMDFEPFDPEKVETD